MAAIDFDVDCPGYPWDRHYERDTFEAPEESRFRKSRAVSDRGRRTYTLRWDNPPSGIVDHLESLIDQVKGNVIAMNYTPDDESEIEVRFKESNIRYTHKNAILASVQVELEEVI